MCVLRSLCVLVIRALPVVYLRIKQTIDLTCRCRLITNKFMATAMVIIRAPGKFVVVWTVKAPFISEPPENTQKKGERIYSVPLLA